MENNASHLSRESAPADVAKETNIEVADSLEIKVDIGIDTLAAYTISSGLNEKTMAMISNDGGSSDMKATSDTTSEKSTMVTGEYQTVEEARSALLRPETRLHGEPLTTQRMIIEELAMPKRTQMVALGSSAEENPMSGAVVCIQGAHLLIDPRLQSPSRRADERAIEEFFGICKPDPEMMACLLAIPQDRRYRLSVLQSNVLLTISSAKRNHDFMPSEEQRQAFMEETIGVSGWLESGKVLSAVCLSNVAKCLLATKTWCVKSFFIKGRENNAAVHEKMEFELKVDKHSHEEHLLDEDTTVVTETEVAKIRSDQEQYQRACDRTDQAIDLLRPENREKVAELEGRQVKDWMELHGRMQIRDLA